MKFRTALILLATVIAGGLPAAAQGKNDYVPRFDLYAGYAYFNTHALGLTEHGFHLQGGLNVKRWLALGLDYSRATGEFGLAPDVLKPEFSAPAQDLVRQFKEQGLVAANYTGAVPTSALTQTFAAGPQLVWRHRRWALIFGPSAGVVVEKTEVKPYDLLTNIFVSEITPTDKTPRDHKIFYGAGASVDIHATRHLSLRVRVDFVHDALFTETFLASGRNTVRVSVGPAFHFGKSLR